jgi:hypothetical protein
VILDVVLTSKLYPSKSYLLQGSMDRLLEIDENSEVTIITENCYSAPKKPPMSIGETSPSKRISPTQISTIKSSGNYMDLDKRNSPVSYQSALDYTSENGSTTPKTDSSVRKTSAVSGTKQRDSIVRGFLGEHTTTTHIKIAIID